MLKLCMPQLRISLLGPFNATLDGRPVTQFRTNKVQALLIYLAAERDQPHQREALMTLLWPDMPLESAQVNLRQTIYRLRQAIPEINQKGNNQSVPSLITDRQTVQLNPDAKIIVDIDAFESYIKKDPVKAIELYHGDFLTDFYLADSNPFEEWAERIRENLHRKAIQVLDVLTENCLSSRDYDGAQRYAWRQLEIDNLRESAYRQLMTALAQDGQRSAALCQYQNCTKRLDAQLGVPPSPETTTLYEQIQTDALRLTIAQSPSHRIHKIDRMPVFILTDIEDSTRLWDIHHRAMLSALLQHNTILEEEITKHGGRILELRGDGVKAVFESGDPLTCMIAIQKRLSLVDWGEIGELKIRIGLHGVPPVRKGYDYFEEDDKYYGPVLNHTARVMDAAWGGQILASEQVRNTFALPGDSFWQDFGEHRVKSVDHPIHIYGLIHPDLPHQSFPPLRTLSSEQQQKETHNKAVESIPHNLPQQATSFVGRQTELDDIISLLNQPKTRLVSIVGPGGMGKTRLALALCEIHVQNCLSTPIDCSYPDGVYFIPLASLDEPGQMIRIIGKILNVPTDSGQSSEVLDHSVQTENMSKERLLEYLKNKHILIVLDNFEHLIEGAELVSNILEVSPGLQIIVTSRERLHIREEQVYPIQGLEFPEVGALKDPRDYTAIELFIQSAQRLLPNFEISAGEINYLIQICNLVGGMPLGLELAASWIDMLSIKDIAEEIRTSLDFLETDVRNIPDRHRSIRAVFDTSWNRLTEVEKQIFSRFSLLRGSFSRSAAQEIAGASIRNLAAFVSKTLLHYNKVTDSYQIHELLRQYGEEHLKKVPEEVFQTQQRHSKYYCSAVKGYMDSVMAGNSHIAFERISADIDNISRAWNWAIQHENIVSVNDAINGLSLFYANAWGSEDGLRINADAVEMLSKYIQHAPPETNQYLSHRLYAKALAWLGFFTFPFDTDGAQEHLNQSQEIINDLMEAGVDARHENALLFFLMGINNLDLGNHQLAKDYTQTCLTISKEIGFDWMVLSAIDLLGDIGNSSGSPREAKIWYEKFLTEAKARNNLSNEIRALHKLGLATRHMMAYDEARKYYQEAISLAKSYKNPMEETYALQSLGFLSLFLGDFLEAIQHFQDVVSISEQMGVPQRALNALLHIGFSNWMQADFIQADSIYRKVLDQIKNKDENSRVFPIIFDAEYRVMHGLYSEAKAQLDIVNNIRSHLFINQFLEGRYFRTLGWSDLAQKNFAAAKYDFEESIRLYQVIADDEQVAWSQAGLARAELGLGNREGAKTLLMEALWTSIEMRAFIPLIFTLPIAMLYLAFEDPVQAASLHQQILSAPLIANSKFFNDIVGQYLTETVSIQSQEEIAAHADPKATLWTAASSILSNWMQVWMEEPEHAKKPNRQS